MVAGIIVDVITMASMYAVLGTGFVIIYMTSRVLNLALGESFMLGGYFVLVSSFIAGAGLQTIPLAILLSILLGLLIYNLVMRPVFGHPVIVSILLTAGISILFQGLAILIWGPHIRVLEWTLGIANAPHSLPVGIVASTSDIATFLIAVIVIGSLFLFLHLSRVGVRMRATAKNPLLSAYRGINVNIIIAIAWGISALSMGMVGITYAGSVRLEPGIGYVALKTLAVPLIGGLDSLKGVIPAAILIALVEYATVRWISPVLAEVAPYILLMIVLMIRPWGLFGTHEGIERV